MMGRTHSVHAEPTTLGHKLAGWAFELDRDRLRLARAFEDAAAGKISGPVGTYSHLRPRPRGRGPRRPRPRRRPGEHADRPARPPRRRPRRDRDHRRLAGALRDRGPQPPAHRDRRADGAVPERPEGQLGDAPQAQPDRRRADRRPGPPAPRLRRRGPREPAALARAGHQPLVGRAGPPARRDDPARLHAGEDDRRSSRGSWSAPTGCARTSSAASASTPAAASSSRSSRTAGSSREEAYAIVQRNALRAADDRVQLHGLLATDPAVAGRLTLARLDACFDDAGFLRHVPAVDRPPRRDRPGAAAGSPWRPTGHGAARRPAVARRRGGPPMTPR